MSRSHPTSIRLDDELKRDLKLIAEWRRWDVASTIRNGLIEWVAYQKKAMGKKK